MAVRFYYTSKPTSLLAVFCNPRKKRSEIVQIDDHLPQSDVCRSDVDRLLLVMGLRNTCCLKVGPSEAAVTGVQ